MNRRTFAKLAGALAAAPEGPAATTNQAEDRLPPDGARFRVDLDELLAPHDLEWTGSLPGHWIQGAPLGNGDFGVMMFGSPDRLGFVLGKTDVWDSRQDTRSFFPGRDFAELRAAYFAGDAEAYLRLVQEAARERSAHARSLPRLAACGRLTLHLDPGVSIGIPSMRVRLRDGVCELRYLDRVVRAAVSRKFGVLLIDCRLGGSEPPATGSFGDSSAPLAELPWELDRLPSEVHPRAIGSARDGFAFLSQRFPGGGGYTVGVASAGFHGSAAHATPGGMAGTATGPAGNRVQIFLTIVSLGDAADPPAECRRRLARALQAGADAILQAHRDWWSGYWMRGLASVGDRGVEKWYYTSLYLCGSILEPGRQSPGLHGVWCGEDSPRWGAGYHANGSIQSIYWGLAANNRVHLMEPYLRHYASTAAAARRVARDYYKLPGLRFPLVGSPRGHDLSEPGMPGVDVCHSAGIVQLFWKYFEYTGDTDFLRETAYPLLRDAARFLVAYLVRDAGTGRLTMDPVPHFEARTYSEELGPRPPVPFELWGRNSLYAQAMFRMALGCAIRGAAELGVDPDLQRQWEDALASLVPPPVTADGYWKAWENYDSVYGWGNFHLPLVFPGELVSRFHGPGVWLDQAKRTWQHLKSAGKASMTGGAWRGGQGVCELLGIGEVADALRAARWPDAQPTNGLRVSPQAPMIEADHGAGMCRVLPDMLLENRDGVLRVFRGIPAGIPVRFLSLRAPGGFLLAGERRRGATPDYLVVRATARRRFRLENPWQGVAVFSDSRSAQRLAASGERLLEFDCEPGRDYRVAPEGWHPEQTPVEDFASPFWVTKDLEYGRAQGKPLLLDLYLPRARGGRSWPLLLSIHGGGWHSGSKDASPGLHFVERGYAVASIDYRLTGEAEFPAQIDDCKAALRWLRANAGRYRLDPERVAAWGASAGGHLAALLGTTLQDPAERIQAVVDFFGPIDVVAWARYKGSNQSNLIRGPLEQTAARLAAANPANFITPDAPPFLIAHGKLDRLVPPQQSIEFHEALRRAGVPATLLLVEQAGHSVSQLALDEQVAEFLARCLR